MKHCQRTSSASTGYYQTVPDKQMQMQMQMEMEMEDWHALLLRAYRPTVTSSWWTHRYMVVVRRNSSLDTEKAHISLVGCPDSEQDGLHLNYGPMQSPMQICKSAKHGLRLELIFRPSSPNGPDIEPCLVSVSLPFSTLFSLIRISCCLPDGHILALPSFHLVIFSSSPFRSLLSALLHQN